MRIVREKEIYIVEILWKEKSSNEVVYGEQRWRRRIKSEKRVNIESIEEHCLKRDSEELKREGHKIQR